MGLLGLFSVCKGQGRSEGQVIDLSIKESKTYPSKLLTINFIQPQNPSDSV